MPPDPDCITQRRPTKICREFSAAATYPINDTGQFGPVWTNLDQFVSFAFLLFVKTQTRLSHHGGPALLPSALEEITINEILRLNDRNIVSSWCDFSHVIANFFDFDLYTSISIIENKTHKIDP